MKETLQCPLIRRKMKAAERVYIYIVYTEMVAYFHGLCYTDKS